MSWLKNMSGEALLAIGGMCMFGLVFSFYVVTEKPAWFFDLSYEARVSDPFLLGEYYFNHDDDPKGPYNLHLARKHYEGAIRESPAGNAKAWHQLGRIDFLEGKYDQALYKFEKQIEYFGDLIPNVYYMIGLTYGYKARDGGNAEDWTRAAEAFKEYIKRDPSSPWVRTDLSWVYFAEGKYEEMKPILEMGLEIHPNNPWLLNMYGLALFNTDHEEEALKQFLHAGREAEKLTVTDWGKAYPGNDPQDWDEGLASFQVAIEKNIALAHFALGTE